MTVATLLPLIGAVLVGGTLQRVSGMGMGLVLSPVLALIFGPASGVTITNLTTFMSALIIGFVLRSGIDWRKFGIIVPSALLGSIPAAAVVRELDSSWLSVLVGILILGALAVTLWAHRLSNLPTLEHWAWLVPFAAFAGFLNTLSGVTAPALIIYAIMARWSQESFSATLQPTFLWIGGVSIVVKVATGATPLGDLPQWWVIPVIVASILVAVFIGSKLSRYVSPQSARKLAIAVAGLGAVSTLLRGLIGTLG